ncbi:MAG: hypothetical protein WDZ91_06250 [Paenibacillaceae bacterium]
MTPFRKVMMGYDVKQVNQYLRKLKFHRELEIAELEQTIVTARKKLALLSRESIPPQNIDSDLNPIVEIAVGLVEEVELLEEVEEIAEGAMVQPIQLQLEPNRMGRLLMFRRKMDLTIEQDEQQSDQISNQGYWESIDHYLVTPAISESFIHSQSVVINSQSQSQHTVTNSAVGLPRYFDYDLSETKTQVYMETTQPIERRVRSITQGTPPNSTKIKSRETSNVVTNQSIDKPAITTVQSQGSNEITREVRQLRYKYIVGKWAGEDLLNNQGEVIIRKNNPITEEVVDTAHLEGKLALLIVQMMIPGLGEDI